MRFDRESHVVRPPSECHSLGNWMKKTIVGNYCGKHYTTPDIVRSRTSGSGRALLARKEALPGISHQDCEPVGMQADTSALSCQILRFFACNFGMSR
jgi:hypothetical protein